MAIPEPSLSKANKSKGEHSPLSFRHFKLGTIAIFVYVGIEVGVPHFANLFMTAQAHEGGLGIDPAIAGSIVGTYWFLMLIGRLIGASLGAQFSSKAMLTVASILGLVLIGIAFVYSIEQRSQHAGIQKRSKPVIRTGSCSCQRNVYGTLRTLYFNHVGRNLQPGCRRTG